MRRLTSIITIEAGTTNLPTPGDNPESPITLHRCFVDERTADWMITGLTHDLTWERRINSDRYGVKREEPRFTCWFGPAYSYGNVHWAENNKWNPQLLELKYKVSLWSGVKFNSVMCNRYVNGHHSVGWHSDNEPHLGKNPVIASISLGVDRRFELRPVNRRAPHAPATHVCNLQHGDLCYMQGNMQQFWQHRVPKQHEVDQPRINLTFRVILPPASSSSRRTTPRKNHAAHNTASE